MADSGAGSTRRLAAGETPPFNARNSGAKGPFVLIGDHAGREIPQRLNGLGLPPEALQRHIALDIGIAGLGALLSDALNAPFISQRFSRLVIDCNRDPARADSICEVSDGTAVPGNLGLTPEERAWREAEIFTPYHQRITAELDARIGAPTTVIALHSFTPMMAGFARPWRYGVLHLGASPYCAKVLARLRAAYGEAAVGDNEPYRMDDIDYSIPHHAVGRGLDYLELEVRQDLLADAEGQATVAADLAPILAGALADLGGPRQYG